MLILMSTHMSEWKPFALLHRGGRVTPRSPSTVLCFSVDLLDLFRVKVVIYALIGKANTGNLHGPVADSVSNSAMLRSSRFHYPLWMQNSSFFFSFKLLQRCWIRAEFSCFITPLSNPCLAHSTAAISTLALIKKEGNSKLGRNDRYFCEKSRKNT